MPRSTPAPCAAILASLVAAWLFQTLNDGQHNDLVEAVVILAAAALMLYVSGWLLVRQDPRAWQAYLKERAEGALAQGTAWAIALLAFLAVFREGAETVLFVSRAREFLRRMVGRNCSQGWRPQRSAW